MHTHTRTRTHAHLQTHTHTHAHHTHSHHTSANAHRQLLDALLPHGAHSISRREVNALVEVHREMAILAGQKASDNPDGMTEVEERLARDHPMPVCS